MEEMIIIKLTDTKTYKLNYTQFMGPLTIGMTHSTGLKNPGLYEFYGSSNWHTGSESVDPEKSKTNELSGKIQIFRQYKIKFCFL